MTPADLLVNLYNVFTSARKLTKKTKQILLAPLFFLDIKS